MRLWSTVGNARLLRRTRCGTRIVGRLTEQTKRRHCSGKTEQSFERLCVGDIKRREVACFPLGHGVTMLPFVLEERVKGCVGRRPSNECSRPVPDVGH